MMEAIILAGGLGTRLQKVLYNVPKPMAPVCDQPFLSILLKTLSRKGFQRVILSLGFMAEKVTDYFGKEFFGMELDYVIEETPLGTGGAVRGALNRCRSDHAFVFNGDTFIDLEVQEVELLWQENRQPIIVGREVSDSTRYGLLLLDGDRVTSFSEKIAGGAGVVNAGCYVLTRNQLDQFDLNTTFSLESDYLVSQVHLMFFRAFVTSGTFIDIGIPEDLKLAQTVLAGFV